MPANVSPLAALPRLSVLSNEPPVSSGVALFGGGGSGVERDSPSRNLALFIVREIWKLI